MEQARNRILEFINITGASQVVAEKKLQEYDWDLQYALSAFYDEAEHMAHTQNTHTKVVNVMEHGENGDFSSRVYFGNTNKETNCQENMRANPTGLIDGVVRDRKYSSVQQGELETYRPFPAHEDYYHISNTIIFSNTSPLGHAYVEPTAPQFDDCNYDPEHAQPKEALEASKKEAEFADVGNPFNKPRVQRQEFIPARNRLPAASPFEHIQQEAMERYVSPYSQHGTLARMRNDSAGTSYSTREPIDRIQESFHRNDCMHQSQIELINMSCDDEYIDETPTLVRRRRNQNANPNSIHCPPNHSIGFEEFGEQIVITNFPLHSFNPTSNGEISETFPDDKDDEVSTSLVQDREQEGRVQEDAKSSQLKEEEAAMIAQAEEQLCLQEEQRKIHEEEDGEVSSSLVADREQEETVQEDAKSSHLEKETVISQAEQRLLLQEEEHKIHEEEDDEVSTSLVEDREQEGRVKEDGKFSHLKEEAVMNAQAEEQFHLQEEQQKIHEKEQEDEVSTSLVADREEDENFSHLKQQAAKIAQAEEQFFLLEEKLKIHEEEDDEVSASLVSDKKQEGKVQEDAKSSQLKDEQAAMVAQVAEQLHLQEGQQNIHEEDDEVSVSVVVDIEQEDKVQEDAKSSHLKEEETVMIAQSEEELFLLEEQKNHEEEDNDVSVSLVTIREQEHQVQEDAKSSQLKEEESDIIAQSEEQIFLKEQQKIQEEEELKKILEERSSNLPLDPSFDDENVVQISVHMPSGTQQRQQFHNSDKLQSLFDFIDASGVKPGSYRLVRQYPKKTFTNADDAISFANLELDSKFEAFFLELI